MNAVRPIVRSLVRPVQTSLQPGGGGSTPPPPPDPDPFSEQGVTFSGSARLGFTSPMLAADPDRLLIFASFTVPFTSKTEYLFEASVETFIRISSSVKLVYDLRAYKAGTVLTPGARINFLAGLDSGSVLTTILKQDGAAATLMGNHAVTVPPLVTGGNLAFGNRADANKPFTGALYRLAIWAPAALPDVTLGATQAQFFDPGGGLADPAISQAAHGTALVDLYGNAASMGAGQHHGSKGGGLFDTVTGSFSDV